MSIHKFAGRSSWVRKFFKFVFNLLYNQLAWSYDLIAWIVSAGLWKSWVLSTLPFLHGERILEIGYGPGHLQLEAAIQRKNIYGVDISWAMATICKNRLLGSTKIPKISLANALALPFPSSSFDQIVTTFPAPYIFETRTLLEIERVLVPGGEFIMIPSAWSTSKFPIQQFFSWLFNLSARPEYSEQLYRNHFLQPLRKNGFQITQKDLIIKKSKVLIILVKKYL